MYISYAVVAPDKDEVSREGLKEALLRTEPLAEGASEGADMA